jgi:hypothetical protein
MPTSLFSKMWNLKKLPRYDVKQNWFSSDQAGSGEIVAVDAL